jgi:hypothetical protein
MSGGRDSGQGKAVGGMGNRRHPPQTLEAAEEPLGFYRRGTEIAENLMVPAQDSPHPLCLWGQNLAISALS